MTVETKYGKLVGTEGKYAIIFKGVPYAQPPVGKLRFHAPQPLQPWNGILHADKFPAMCPHGLQEEGSFYQKEFYNDPEYMPPQSEDCLYLNIWCQRMGQAITQWQSGSMEGLMQEAFARRWNLTGKPMQRGESSW